MKIKERIFKIVDIDCDVITEIVNRQKDILDCMDEYIENCQYEWYGADDDTFEIIYKDGFTDYINSDYDGHKVKRNNILSLVWNNACTSVVYGNFSINDYGVVSASVDENISNNNICEVC